jgi:hypothetical protein
MKSTCHGFLQSARVITYRTCIFFSITRQCDVFNTQYQYICPLRYNFRYSIRNCSMKCEQVWQRWTCELLPNNMLYKTKIVLWMCAYTAMNITYTESVIQLIISGKVSSVSQENLIVTFSDKPTSHHYLPKLYSILTVFLIFYKFQ